MANSFFHSYYCFSLFVHNSQAMQNKMLQFWRKIGLFSLGGREGRRKQALYFDRIQSRLKEKKKIKWIILQYFVRLCILKTQLIRYACKFNMGCQLSWVFFFFYYFLLQLCSVKIGLLWEVTDRSAVLLQWWLQRVGWLPVWEVEDSFGLGCGMFPASFAQPALVSALLGSATCGANREASCILLSSLSLYLTRVREMQRRICSRCLGSVYFPILLFVCNKMLGEERGKNMKVSVEVFPQTLKKKGRKRSDLLQRMAKAKIRWLSSVLCLS